MPSEQTRQKMLPWLPAAFCAFLSLMTIVVQILLTALSGDTSWGWSITFLCFLPMCFFFVGQATYQLRREIVELRAQIASLQNPANDAPRG